MNTTIPAGAIVIGVDGSAGADLAVEWGAREAFLEQRPLCLVHAAPPLYPGETPYPHEILEQLRAEGGALLEHAAERVRVEYDSIEIRTVVRQTDPREALLDAAADASMMVVGTRGLGPIRQLLLGSVSQALTKHAACPVVVLRPAPAAGVRVGVAGDDGDQAVLDFAFRVAAARGLPVTLVHCFWDVVGVPEGVREIPVDEPGCEDQRAILVDAATASSARFPSVPVHLLLSRGFADLQLIAASRAAELLVVGHRRKPLLRDLIHGSVAPRVAEHAHCSVAVVPVGHEDNAGPSASP